MTRCWHMESGRWCPHQAKKGEFFCRRHMPKPIPSGDLFVEAK